MGEAKRSLLENNEFDYTPLDGDPPGIRLVMDAAREAKASWVRIKCGKAPIRAFWRI